MSETIRVNNAKRIDWIDVLKALGMFSIIYWHICSQETKAFFFVTNVPVFFFVSGFLSKTNGRTIDFLKKKVMHLLVPYFIWVTISFLYWIIFERQFRSELAAFSVVDGLKGIFLAEQKYIMYNGTLWFLPVLFIVEVSFFLIQKLFIKFKFNKTVTIVVSSILILISMYGGYVLQNTELPWGVNRALKYSIYFLVGIIFNRFYKKNTKLEGFISDKKMWIVLLVFVSVVTSFLIRKVIGIENKNIFMFYAYYFPNVIGLFGISILLQKIGFLKYIGARTMALLILHGPYYRILLGVAGKLFKFNIGTIRDNYLSSLLIMVLTIALVLGTEFVISRFCPILFGITKKPKVSSK